MVDLGTIERVDLREVWPHEAQDFTPWLAENLDVLGEALGLDLELRSAEAAVGTFSLDVLAHDLGSDRPVIIENQLEATNHDHLGKLLTYAAGHDAYAAVWLVRDFRDEHRQALDWLNQRTGDDTQFFGVIVEAWTIDGSRPAPHFRLVVFPNDWQNQASSGTSAAMEEWGPYREYWQSLANRLKEEDQSIQVTEAKGDSRFDVPSGFDGVIYRASFAPGLRLAHVGVYIDCGDKSLNKKLFDRLRDKSSAIESGLGNKLAWDRRDNKRACRVREEKPEAIHYGNPDALRDWMVDRLLAFKRVFTPHLQKLTE